MSARLVSRKPRPYASFVAVSISRVRLSGCAVRIFSDSELVIKLTQSVNPMRPCCQPPRDTPILGAGGAPYDPFLLAAHLGVPVNEVDLNGIDGYVESHGNNYCVFLSSRGSRVRRRFTLSHELAHVIFMQTARRGG